jgi:hypothetical protein
MKDANVTAMMGVLDTHLRWENSKSGPRGFERYHPSAFGGCLRKMQYLRYAERGIGGLKLPVEKLESQQIRLFDKGHNMHERWTKYADRMGILRGYWQCRNPLCQKFNENGKAIGEMSFNNLEPSRVYGESDPLGVFKPEVCVCGCKNFKYNEVTVQNKEMNIYGHADMIWDFSRLDVEKYKGIALAFNLGDIPKAPVVVDMKTCKDTKYKTVLKSGPSLEYIVQLTIYANILPVGFGLLIYENKNDSNVTAFKIDKNEETIFAKVKEQAIKMELMVEKKILPPPRPIDKGCYECSGTMGACPFRAICHSGKIWEDPQLDEKRAKFYGNLM